MCFGVWLNIFLILQFSVENFRYFALLCALRVWVGLLVLVCGSVASDLCYDFGIELFAESAFAVYSIETYRTRLVV